MDRIASYADYGADVTDPQTMAMLPLAILSELSDEGLAPPASASV